MPEKTLGIDDVKPGMVVAVEVVDPRGNILVRRGVALNDAWIKGIKMRGVTKVVVQQAAAEPAAAAPAPAVPEPLVGTPAERAVAEKYRKIDAMFAHCREHPVMGALAEAARNHARSKLVEEPKS